MIRFLCRFSRRLAAARWAIVLVGLGLAVGVAAQEWQPLHKDELHDPKGSGIKLLQQPAEALSKLPRDTAGNQVRWVDALEQGFINPRTNILPETKVRVYEKDVLLDLYGSMPIVRFPHRNHTIWLDCNNCHDHLFKQEAGGSRISMLNILEGEQCGLCHGAVAFPLTECARCHSVSRRDFRPPPKLRAIVVERGQLPPSYTPQ